MRGAVLLGLTLTLLLAAGLVGIGRPLRDRTPAATPAVSAGGPLDAAEPAALEGRLAARIEVDGRRFHVYVGNSPADSETSRQVWSVAFPAED